MKVEGKNCIENLILSYEKIRSPNSRFILYKKEDIFNNKKNPYKSLKFYVLDTKGDFSCYKGNLLDGQISWSSDHVLKIEEVVGNISDNNSNKVTYKNDLLSKQRISIESENKYL